MKDDGKTKKQLIAELNELRQQVTTLEKAQARGNLTAHESHSKTEMFRLFFEFNPEYCFLISPQDEILDVNQAALRILEYNKPTLVGQSIKKIFTPKSISKLQNILAKLDTIDHLDQEELDIISKSGDRRTVILSAHVVKDEYAKITHYVLIQKELSSRENTAEYLRRSEELLASTQRLTKVGGWEWDVQKQTMFWTDETYRIHGYNPDEIERGSNTHIDRSVECYDPDDRPVILEAFEKCAKEGEPYDIEFPLITVQGQRKWIRTAAKAVRKNGRITKVIGNIVDITDYKRIEDALEKSELLLRSIVDATPVCIYVKDFHGTYIFVNKFIADLYGTTCEEMIGKTDLDFADKLSLAKEDALAFIQDDQDVINNNQTKFVPEEPFTLPDGTIKWFQTTKLPISLIGNPNCLLGVSEDITRRKLVENTLIESKNQYSYLLEAISDSVYVLDSEWRHVIVNDAATRFVRMSKEELISSKLTELFPGIEGTAFFKVFQRVMESRIPDVVEDEYFFEDGRKGWYEVSVYPVPPGILCISRDITDRRRAEYALKESENLFRSLYNNLPGGMMLIDAHYRIREVNPQTCQITGYSRDELVGELCEIICPKGIDSKNCPIWRQGKTNLEGMDTTIKCKSGYYNPILKNARRVIINGEEHILEIFQDTRQQKEAEKAVRESEEKFRLLAENSVDCIWTMDTTLRFTYLSPALKKMMGVQPNQWIGTELKSHFKKEEYLKFGLQAEQAIKNQDTFTDATIFETKMLDKNNKEIELEISATALCNHEGTLIGLQGTAKDITKRKIAENSLLYRIELEKLIADISTRFIGAVTDAIDDEINRTLRLVGQFTHVDRSYLFLISKDGKTLTNTHEWCAKGIEPQIENLKVVPAKALPWWMGKLTQLENIHVPSVADMPAEADSEQKILQGQDIQSVLVVPVFYSQKLLGFIGFDSVKNKKSWTMEDITLLRTIGEIIANKLQSNWAKKDIETLLQNLRERFKEMRLLYQVSQLSTELDQPLDDFLQKTVDAIPEAWEYQEITCARITLNNKHFNTHNFRNTEWVQSEDIRVRGTKVGMIEVCYLKQMPIKDEGPFLKEERVLLESLASHIASYAERKQAEEQIRSVNDKLQRIFDSSTSGIIVVDAEGKITEWNKASEQIFGWKEHEVIGKFNPTVHENDRDFYFKTLREHHANIEIKSLTKDNFLVDILLSSAPLYDENANLIGAVGVMSDITERKRAEEERAKLEAKLRRSQKMETIGTLAGGIAHDFNNILTPIMGYTDMAILSLPTDDPLVDDLKNVLKGAQRAKELVRQILTFSRQIEQERKPLKLHLIIKEAIKLIRPSIPTTIEIRQRIDESCDEILADPSQIHQVIVNLCTNAYQAMEVKGGTLTIELAQIEIDAATEKIHPNLKPAEYVRLTVSDTGIGMDSTTMERIFEPFFTTKAVDKGTGMGLSVVHGIVKSHHGEIIVQSKSGDGSTFHIYFPTIIAEAEIHEKKKAAMPGGQETILIVDDEKAVTSVLKRMLVKLGYTVSVQTSSIEALKTVRLEANKYDLVISDLTMPEMTGLDLSIQLHKIQPDLPIIIMTGYGENITDDVIKKYGIHQVIGKPIEMEFLAKCVRNVLVC